MKRRDPGHRHLECHVTQASAPLVPFGMGTGLIARCVVVGSCGGAGVGVVLVFVSAVGRCWDVFGV